jgi:hypothetical protein
MAEAEEYHPIRGKCTWWRERLVDEDRWDITLKAGQRRVECSCFVEGHLYTWPRNEVPPDCPDNRRCRYYIKVG